MLLTETWLKSKDKFFHPSFKTYRNDRQDVVGGGVAISLRNNIKHKILPAFKTEILETIALRLEELNLNIVVAYFPGTKLNVQKLKAFENDLKLLISKNEKLLLCGDLNARHRHWNCVKANKAGKILFDLVCERNLFIHTPTRPTFLNPRGYDSTLDLVISNGRISIDQPVTGDKLSSPHLPVAFQLTSETSLSNSDESVDRIRINWLKFKKYLNDIILLKNLNLAKISSTDQIDSLISTFYCHINSAIKFASYPEQADLFPNQVIDEGTKFLISSRNYLRRQWQKTRSRSTKTVVNKLTKAIQSRIFGAKNKRWGRMLQEIPKNGDKLWKLNKLLKKKKIIPPMRNAGDIIYDDESKAELLANQFQKAHFASGSVLFNKTVQQRVEKLRTSLCDFDARELCSPREIKAIIKHLKVKKAPGPDRVTNSMVKNFPRKAIVYYNFIVNSCLKLSYFPKVWKEATVVPIVKPGKDPKLADSYRPVSLISSLSKIFERVILARVNKILNQTNLLPDFQFGFRPKHSTSHQVFRVTSEIQKIFKDKESLGFLTLDIHKAFDSVWHYGLVYKLLLFRFPIYLVKLLLSFLTGRRFTVKVGSKQSSDRSIPAGVPQGSPLSPILFSIYTSDIPTAPGCKLAAFADDVGIISSSNDPSTIMSSLENQLDSLYQFYFRWKIKLNPSKTQAVFFTKKRCEAKLPSRDINFLGESIKWCNSLTYLGVVLDKKLTFKDHTDSICSKISKSFCSLYSLLHRNSKLSVDNKLIMFRMVIQPIISYCAPVWSQCARTHKLKVQRAQNKILKVILNKSFDFSTEKLHNEAKVKYVEDLCLSNSVRFMNNCRAVGNPLINILCSA